MKILYISITLLTLAGCSFAQNEMTNVRVVDSGSDTAGSFCSDFSLTNSQALDFISKSREVEISEFHDRYEYLPCYVKGKLIRGNNECDFTIRAGATLELSCDDNSAHLYVCDSCDDLLGASQ